MIAGVKKKRRRQKNFTRRTICNILAVQRKVFRDVCKRQKNFARRTVCNFLVVHMDLFRDVCKRLEKDRGSM